ncbi:MAG: carboxymuconolactone decarboxylase family protein [Chloroflexi bacterium]|nr:carboxymuconolactone decarboxylase family protein [Chloroflexota bacterium]
MATSDERYQRGLQVRLKLSGGKQPISPSGGLMPDLDRFATEACFGDVWARPGLEMKLRSLATISALTVLGREAQLKSHVGYALNLGWKKDELLELFMHLAFYGGLPASLAAMRAAGEVFKERGL